MLHEDIDLRESITQRLHHAGISKVDIERAANKLKIDIHTACPGIVIGRKGAEVDRLKREIERKTGREVFINIQEVHRPELDAQLVSENVAMQLERRVAPLAPLREEREGSHCSACRAKSEPLLAAQHVRIRGRTHAARVSAA